MAETDVDRGARDPGEYRPLRWVSGMCLAVAFTACSVSSIDSETKALIDACKEIKSEALRVECLADVPTTEDQG